MELPVELLTLIFVRLSVKTLSRFKSVSKEWYSFISDPHFAQFHSSCIPIGGHSDDHRLITITQDRDQNSWYAEHWNLLDSHLTHITNSLIPFSGKNQHESFKLCCEYNGLLILIQSYEGRDRYSQCKQMIMWNTWTNDYSVIPFPKHINDRNYDYPKCCFAYDKSNDDYKLVMFDNNFKSTTQVYSSKRGCWAEPRTIEFGFGFMCWSGIYTAIGNHIIPAGRHPYGCDRYYLIRFDISSEEWLDHIPCPDLGEGYFLTGMGVLDNRLFITSKNKDGYLVSPKYSIYPRDIWVMKEYGVEESWIKLLSVTMGVLCSPITYSMGDGILLQTYPSSSTYYWYNFKDKTMEKALESNGKSRIMVHCVASLVRVPRWVFHSLSQPFVASSNINSITDL